MSKIKIPIKIDNDIDAEESEKTLNFSKDLKYVILLGDAFLKKDFSAIKPLMAEYVDLVLCDSKTIVGIQNVIDFWKNNIIFNAKDADEDISVPVYTVTWCKWFAKPALYVSPISDYIILHTSYGLITRIEQVSDLEKLNFELKCGRTNDCNYPILYWDRLKTYNIRDTFRKRLVARTNHFSCLNCDIESENLTWNLVELPVGLFGYLGELSICPQCERVIEFIPRNRVKYNEMTLMDGMDANDDLIEKSEDLFPF